MNEETRLIAGLKGIPWAALRITSRTCSLSAWRSIETRLAPFTYPGNARQFFEQRPDRETDPIHSICSFIYPFRASGWPFDRRMPGISRRPTVKGAIRGKEAARGGKNKEGPRGGGRNVSFSWNSLAIRCRAAAPSTSLSRLLLSASERPIDRASLRAAALIKLIPCPFASNYSRIKRDRHLRRQRHASEIKDSPAIRSRTRGRVFSLLDFPRDKEVCVSLAENV